MWLRAAEPMRKKAQEITAKQSATTQNCHAPRITAFTAMTTATSAMTAPATRKDHMSMGQWFPTGLGGAMRNG